MPCKLKKRSWNKKLLSKQFISMIWRKNVKNKKSLNIFTIFTWTSLQGIYWSVKHHLVWPFLLFFKAFIVYATVSSFRCPFLRKFSLTIGDLLGQCVSMCVCVKVYKSLYVCVCLFALVELTRTMYNANTACWLASSLHGCVSSYLLSFPIVSATFDSSQISLVTPLLLQLQQHQQRQPRQLKLLSVGIVE